MATNVDIMRISCPYGINCYSLNPNHKRQYAHPYDEDYRRPNILNNSSAPPCRYYTMCYRRNPQHFKDFSHPDADIYYVPAMLLRNGKKIKFEK